ncbi:PREDICTED: probable 6-phosphogluconolactonase 4, chloroplastic isoform X1 [Nelumbo nucifera]|uniref:6-phosphogluconolactonase n=1 Tax=Nelumbo nucifera TaxID=4432 RepID=A0A1U8Q7F6_NELNU|nr:PREDICTED: probable 6-phosphogluconolactonase 4, chloroplastic isoform X1 [Nelumbo nucifera]
MGYLSISVSSRASSVGLTPVHRSSYIPVVQSLVLAKRLKTPICWLRTKAVSLSARDPIRFRSAMAGTATTEKGKGDLQVFESEEDLSVSLAKYTADLSEKFIRERGAFTVVLSGGSLIQSLRKLLESPYLESVDWTKWHVSWVDERVVPKNHEDSNYKLAYDGFLSKVHKKRKKENARVSALHCIRNYIFCTSISQVPIPPGNIYAINDTLTAEGAADDYEACLKQLVNNKVVDLSAASGFPKFDLMLLGMGPDGHVASLFPGHPLVNENKRWVTFIKDSPKPPPERITYTFPVINSSASIALVVCGSGKADAVHRALGNQENSDLLPVQIVSPEGKLTWFLDKPAASKL